MCARRPRREVTLDDDNSLETDSFDPDDFILPLQRATTVLGVSLVHSA